MVDTGLCFSIFHRKTIYQFLNELVYWNVLAIMVWLADVKKNHFGELFVKNKTFSNVVPQRSSC